MSKSVSGFGGEVFGKEMWELVEEEGMSWVGKMDHE